MTIWGLISYFNGFCSCRRLVHVLGHLSGGKPAARTQSWGRAVAALGAAWTGSRVQILSVRTHCAGVRQIHRIRSVLVIDETCPRALAELGRAVTLAPC